MTAIRPSFTRRNPKICVASIALLSVCCVEGLPSSAHAATFIRANTASALNLPAAWTDGTLVPGATDIARWDSILATAGNATAALGADTTWGQIQIVNPVAGVVISAGNTLTLNGVGGIGLDMSAATQNLTFTAPLALGGTQIWNIANGRTVTVNSAVTGFNQGANALTINGGSFTFSSNNTTTYNSTATGAITLNGATLTLGATTTNPTFAGVTNMISGLTPLTVSGAVVAVNTGASVGNNNQTFNGLTVNAGATNFTQARGSSSNSLVNFGAITRNVGGTITLNSASTATTGGFRTTTGSNGIVGGYAVLGTTDYARWTASGTSIMSATPAVYVSNTWASTNNTTVTAAAIQTDATTNSLRFGSAAALTLTLAGTNTISTGGLLNSSGVGAFNNVITGGTLIGAAGADLIVHQWNTAGTLDIQSAIADNTTATALTKAGTGTLILSNATNSFTGGIFVNAGVLQVGVTGALNSNPLTFTNNSGGTLRLAGNNAFVSGLNTSTVVPAVAPIVENANAANAVLTVNNATASAYAGSIQNGTGGGTLGIAKTGAGTLTLSGTNTYTGATTINNGTLLVKSSIASSTSISVTSPGILDVTTAGLAVASGNSLSGNGSVLGTVTAGSGAVLTPGLLNAGSASTLTLGSVNLNNGANLNFDLFTGGTSDLISVTGGLNLGSGAVINVNLAGSGANATGSTFTFFNYGSLTNFSPSSFSIASGGTGGLTYTFADTGSGSITLAITGTIATNSTWALTGGGSWATPSTNWTPNTVPNGAGHTANFGTSITGSSTINLDGNKTVGALTFNNTHTYTIATGSSGNLILDNGAGSASITDNSTGSTGQIISADVTLNSNTIATIGSAEKLTVSGSINGAGGLTKAGAGTLDLTAANLYAGPTSLNLGTLKAVTGALSNTAFTFGGGTLQYATGNTEDLSSGRVVTFAGTAVIDTNGNNVAYASPVGNAGPGGLTKTGAGILTVASGNTHTGVNQISGGTLNIASDTSLGAVPGAAGTNLIIDGGSTLQAGAATIALNVNRNVSLNGGTAVIDTNGNALTINGVVSGTGILDKTGAGTLTLNGTDTYARTIVDAGTLVVGTAGTAVLGSGSVTLNGTGALNLGARNLGNDLVVNGTSNLVTSGDGGGASAINKVTGAGVLAVNVTAGNVDLRGDLTAFTGTVQLATANTFRLNGTTGGTGTTLDLGTGFANVRNGNTQTINWGALAGTAGALSGNTATAGTTTFSIGAKNIPSTYGGAINNGSFANAFTALTKVGSDVLTLTGTNGYTGVTTITSGTLQLGDGTTGHDGTIAGSTSIVNNSSLVYNRFDTTPTYGGVISGTGTVQKLGVGTQTLTGANIYTGATNVNAGVLVISGSISATTAISVTGGAALQLGTANALNDAATVSLGGGSLGTLGFSDTVGALSLAVGTSTIDFGTGASVLHFADSSASTWTGTLSITNWSGAGAGLGTDQLYFGSASTGLTSGQLSQITFVNPEGFAAGNYAATILASGEVVAVVPEPSVWVSVVGGVGMLLGLRRRRNA